MAKSTNKIKSLEQEQKEMKGRLKKIESLLNRLTSEELFEDLSNWGQKFAQQKEITKKQVIEDD